MRSALALLACVALFGMGGAPSPVGTARAAERVVAFDSDADRARYERLLHEYRCLKCQNQSIADSGASLADDLRRQIHDRVVAGDDDAAIDEFLVSRYGEFVRYRPRFGTTTALLWVGPFALLAVGLGAGVLMARRGTRAREAAPSRGDDPAARRARRGSTGRGPAVAGTGPERVTRRGRRAVDRHRSGRAKPARGTGRMR